MTKDELIAEAEKLGLKIRTGFMDDWMENIIILLTGLCVGYILGYLKVFFG